MKCDLCGGPGASTSGHPRRRKIDYPPRLYHPDCLTSHRTRLKRQRLTRLAKRWERAGQMTFGGFDDGV